MAAVKKTKKTSRSAAAGPLRAHQHRPEYAAGIVLADAEGIVCVTRGKLANGRYDYGIPAKLQRFREWPEQTARRALLQETGLSVWGSLRSLCLVPAEMGVAGVPLVVYVPEGPVQGVLRGSESGIARVVTLQHFISLEMSHAVSNRIIAEKLYAQR